MSSLYTYTIRWRARDGTEESRTTSDIYQATKLRNYLLANNVQSVDLAVKPVRVDSMFPTKKSEHKKYQFKKIP